MAGPTPAAPAAPTPSADPFDGLDAPVAASGVPTPSTAGPSPATDPFSGLDEPSSPGLLHEAYGGINWLLDRAYDLGVVTPLSGIAGAAARITGNTTAGAATEHALTSGALSDTPYGQEFNRNVAQPAENAVIGADLAAGRGIYNALPTSVQTGIGDVTAAGVHAGTAVANNPIGASALGLSSDLAKASMVIPEVEGVDSAIVRAGKFLKEQDDNLDSVATTQRAIRTAAGPPSDEEALTVGANRTAEAAPAAAAPVPAVPIVHDADAATGAQTFTSPNGATSAQENGKYLQVKRSDTAPAAQGTGEGTARLAAVADAAKAQGLTPASDVSVSPAEAATWQRYGRENDVPIKQNPSTVNPDTGNLVSADPRVPVFEQGTGKPPMLNVGMAVPGSDVPLTQGQVIDRIQATGAKVLQSSVHQSGTEPTVVATLDRDLTSNEGNTLASQLHQGAIPQRGASGAGTMFGPKADQWGPYNPQYFLDHNGKPLEEAPKSPGEASAAAAPPPNSSGVASPQWGAPVPTDRAGRVAALQDVGIHEAPHSVLDGDRQGTSDDFQASQFNGKGTDRMREVIRGVRTGLQNRADAIVSRAGGTATNPEERGTIMAKALDSGYNAVDQATQSLYAVAKAQAATKGPIEIPTFTKYLADHDLDFTRSDEAANFRKRLNGAMKRLSFDKGPQDATGIERLRQWIGSAYDRKAADLQYGLKDALDDDVAKATGNDAFQASRAMRKFRADNFDNAKGVSEMLREPNDPFDVNRRVPFEKVPTHVASLSNAQFNHLIDTYQNIGKMFPNLRGQSADAIREARAELADRINAAGNKTAGSWNAPNVTAEVKKNGPKIARVFAPEGQQMIHQLQQAGEVARMDTGYKGAFVQGSNMMNTLLGHAGKGAEMVGAAVHGLPGYLIGHGLGKATTALKERAATRAIEKRIADLDEEPAAGGAGGKAPFRLAQREPLSTSLPGQRGGPKYTGPSSLEQIKPYFQDDELPANALSARNLVDNFHSLPPTHEMAAMALQGASMRDWYRNAAETIGGVFKADAPRFTALLASLSPVRAVGENLHDAINVWADWHKAGRPIDPEQIAKIVKKQAPYLANATTQNVVRSLTSGNPADMVLSGPKVHSFYRNLMGNVQDVTLDGWMAKGAGLNPKALGGGINPVGTTPGKGTMYRAYAAKQREAAALLSNLTGEKWDPDQVQAGEWSFLKTAWERADTLNSIPDMVKRGEIDDKLIAATPTFHNLFGANSAGLARAGLSAEAAGLPAGESAYAPSEATQAARKVLAGHLTSAVNRLEVARREEAPLTGLPNKTVLPGQGVVGVGPFMPAREAAKEYTQDAGIPYNPPRDYAPINPAEGKKIANAYAAMKHAPDDPKVQSAYNALINETLGQWQAIKKTGLNVEFIKPGQADPYAASPRLAIEDVKNNNHLWVFPTEGGFGSSDADVSNNPLLRKTDEIVDGRPLLANDVFRIVHDYFGHVKEGVGFRADGEYNAWRQHAAMYSKKAQGALASETLGQNSWVNFGPNAATNKGANSANTVYADQKAGLMPEKLWRSDHGEPGADVPF